jgi:hypothetical protein
MALMRNEGRMEYEDNERGIAWIEERKRMTTICQGREEGLELVPTVDITGTGARPLTLRRRKPT